MAPSKHVNHSFAAFGNGPGVGGIHAYLSAIVSGFLVIAVGTPLVGIGLGISGRISFGNVEGQA